MLASSSIFGSISMVFGDLATGDAIARVIRQAIMIDFIADIFLKMVLQIMCKKVNNSQYLYHF